MKGKKALLIHGGAGTILKSRMTSELEEQYKIALRKSINAGMKILNEGGSSTDAVIAAVVEMEDSPLFNAGKGAVFNSRGSFEMDAAVMRGDNLEAGAAAGVSGVKNPIVLAKDVLEKSQHVMLSGKGAIDFALENGHELVDDAYFYTDQRHQQYLEVKDSDQIQLDHTPLKGKVDKYGTVGAVALDLEGNISAATSTGGLTNKKYTRIGDSPIIGSGTYANNKTCAVSCTGDGEFFIRGVVGYDISCLMEYKNLSLSEACDVVIHDKLKKLGGEGGVIAIDAQGNLAFPFNTAGMYRAYQKNDSEICTGIYGEEDEQ